MIWRSSMVLGLVTALLFVGLAPADGEKDKGDGEKGKGKSGKKGGFGGRFGGGGFGGFGARQDPAKLAEELMTKFDKNKDGKLDAKELAAALKSLQEQGGMG